MYEFNQNKGTKSKLAELSSWFDEHVIVATVTIVLIIVGCFAFYKWTFNRQLEELHSFYNTLYAFMSTATEDEYADMAEELHDCMVLRTLKTEDLEFLDLIPNTAAACPLHGELPGALYLAALNTGKLYSITSAPGSPDYDAAGGRLYRFGYDEVSRSSLKLSFDFDAETTDLLLERSGGEISIQHMKGRFCENCIYWLARTLTDQSVLEFVLFDPADHAFYPIAETAQYEIAGYGVSVSRDHADNPNNYEIEVRSIDFS